MLLSIASSLGKSPCAAIGASMYMMGPGGGAQVGYAAGGAVRTCQKCGRQSPADQKFCSNWGAKFEAEAPPAGGKCGKVPKFCPECGAAAGGAKLCPECGAKLT